MQDPCTSVRDETVGAKPPVFGYPDQVIGISDAGTDRPRLETWCLREGSEKRLTAERTFNAQIFHPHWAWGVRRGKPPSPKPQALLKPPTDAAGHQPWAVGAAADAIQNAETEVDSGD